MTVKVLSTASWPGSALSNFAPHAFEFEGVQCGSMEGLLQAFKFSEEAKQIEVCKLVGFDAKVRGQAGNGWKANQALWWKRVCYDRHAQGYQALLDRAFIALSKNPEFREALLTTGKQQIVHPLGGTDPNKTILTVDEFCDRLVQIRQLIQNIGQRRHG